MNGHHANSRQTSRGSHGPGYGVGDVTELQVKEDPGSQLGDSTNALRPFSREKLAAYFNQTDSVAEPANEADGLVYVWKVKRYDQFTGGVSLDEGTLSSSTLTRAVPRLTKPNSLATW